MNLEEAIYAQLTTDTTIASLIDAGSGKFHLYPLRTPDGVPEEVSSIITYTEIKQDLIFPALRKSTFQFSCFGKTFENARDLANAVDNALNSFRSGLLGGVKPVVYVMFENRSALYDDTAKLWYYVVDVSFKY